MTLQVSDLREGMTVAYTYGGTHFVATAGLVTVDGILRDEGTGYRLTCVSSNGAAMAPNVTDVRLVERVTESEDLSVGDAIYYSWTGNSGHKSRHYCPSLSPRGVVTTGLVTSDTGLVATEEAERTGDDHVIRLHAGEWRYRVTDVWRVVEWSAEEQLKALQAEFREFRRTVHRVATKYGQKHSLCSVLDDALAEVGLPPTSQKTRATFDVLIRARVTSTADRYSPSPSWTLGSVVVDQEALRAAISMDHDWSDTDVTIVDLWEDEVQNMTTEPVGDAYDGS